jgi:hypothetical protein
MQVSITNTKAGGADLLSGISYSTVVYCGINSAGRLSGARRILLKHIRNRNYMRYYKGGNITNAAVTLPIFSA